MILHMTVTLDKYHEKLRENIPILLDKHENKNHIQEILKIKH